MPISLVSLELGMSFSLRTAKESNLLDYQFASDFNYKDHIKAELEYERENGSTYFNYSTELTQKWTYLTLAVKRNSIEWLDIDNISVEALGRYFVEQEKTKFFLIRFISNGYWEAGIRQQWDKGIPSTNIVLGKSFEKDLNFFLTPAKFEYSINYFSSDFKKWLNESYCTISFSLLANLDFYLEGVLKPDFFRFKTGIKIHTL